MIEHIFLALLTIGIGVAIHYGVRSLSFKRSTHEIDDQFQQLKVASADPRLAFDGSIATIVLDREESIEEYNGIDGAGPKIGLHRICKNAHGEYFLYINGDEPYITHLSRERAMNALRADKAVFEKEFGVVTVGSSKAGILR